MHRRKTGREKQEGSILHLSQGDKIHWFLCPIPLRPAKQGDPKSVHQGVIRALPSLSSQRAAISTKQEIPDLLTQVGPCLEMDSYFIRNYKLLEISWDTPDGKCRDKENTPIIFPEERSVLPRADSGNPPLQLQ